MNIRLSRVITRVIGLMAVSFLILGLLLTSIEWAAFDLNYYHREYKKLGIARSTGMSQDDLLNTTKELLNYVKGKRDNLKVSAVVHGEERQVFNQREIDHMVDVKDLFTLGFRLRWISFGIFLALAAIIVRLKGRDALRELSLSYLTVLAILIVFALVLLGLILIDFTAVWDKFHHIFFSNDLWILDPETDILIQMVPEEFFFDTVMRILGLFGSVLTALAVCSGIIFFTQIKCTRSK